MASSSSSHKLSFSEAESETFTASSCDAFINCGSDVKDTLAFALKVSLEEKGFSTFLDDQELQAGDLIKPVIDKAMYSSKVQIAIFSPGYAHSPWCLHELVNMLQTKALFIPVFCDVKPSEIRYPRKGVYAAAFAKHEKKEFFSDQEIRRWEAALHYSSIISGYKFSTSNDNVEKLCLKIAFAVQQNSGNTFKGFPKYVEDAKHSAQVKKPRLLPRDSHKEMFTESKKKYDAFINHRGFDVGETVAFALYDSLEEMGFSTFLEDVKLELGDSIECSTRNAICSSSVHIAIFTPRYAESPRSLNQLVDMLKIKALFIPVFCDVKPSDLRYLDKGLYAAVFAKHEEKGRFSNEKIHQWKEALHSSSIISGYEFSTSNDNVEMLCSKIVLAVQQNSINTFKGFPKYVEDAKHSETSAQWKKSRILPRDSHPVGIDSKVEDMVGLLEKPEDRVIAVVGMGGLGKTFLLQHVYRALKSSGWNDSWLSGREKMSNCAGRSMDILDRR
ncbi:hypothetical protein SUGI_0232460 [Cryptomeria japonica]|nr:hypothetical protein SUGI_0232460 [Cryptomeria japonica]